MTQNMYKILSYTKYRIRRITPSIVFHISVTSATRIYVMNIQVWAEQIFFHTNSGQTENTKELSDSLI